MRNFLLLLLPVLFSAAAASAQKVVDITDGDNNASYREQLSTFVGGTIFPLDKYIKIKEGSPYYVADWSAGSIVTESGKTYQNLQVKLDLLNHEIHYKDKDGNEMIVTVPIRQLILSPAGSANRIFIPGKQWADVDKKLADSWLLVLVNDTVSLLCDIRKKVTEGQAYNSATAEQTIDDKEVYFLQKNGRLNRIGRWSELQELLADKRKEVAKYIKDNDLRGNSQSEYAQVVTYYNTL